MEENVINEDKKYTAIKDNIHIKKDEQKHPCHFQDNTTFIRKDIKTEVFDHDCSCADSSMKITDYSIVKNEENDVSRLPFVNSQTFYNEESVFDYSIVKNEENDVTRLPFVNNQTFYNEESVDIFLNTRVPFQGLVCVLCNASLINFKHLKSHIEYHLDEQKFINESNFQKKNDQFHHFNDRSSYIGTLNTHFDGKQKQLKPYKCLLCDYTSSRKGTLKNHIDTIHKQLKPHKCPICDYTSSQKGTLNRHINSIHTQLKPHKVSRL